MTRNPKIHASRIVAFTIGLAMTIMMIELTLRVLSVIWALDGNAIDSKLKSHITSYFEGSKDGKEVIRIVALGESTTAKFYNNGYDVSWPARLQRILNETPEVLAGKREIRVLNIAQPGTSTTFLVDELEALLSTPAAKANPPQYVISMMGINDSASVVPQKSWLFQTSYTARFAFWAWRDFLCHDCYRISRVRKEDNVVTPDSRAKPLFNSLPIYRWPESKPELDRIEALFVALANQNSNQREDLYLLWGKWLFEYSERLIVLEASGLTEKAKREGRDPLKLRLYVLNLAKSAYQAAGSSLRKLQGSIKHACFVYNRLGDDKSCRDLVLAGIADGVELTPDLLMVAMSSGGSHDTRLNRLLTDSGYRYLGYDKALIATRSSYLRMGELAKRHDFHWLIMQYPMGSVGGFKKYFSALSDQDFLAQFPNALSLFFIEDETPDAKTPGDLNFRHSFVSNSNFKELAIGEKQADYFLDLFAKGAGLPFGHTTELGHKQIAINVVNVMTPLIARH
jgi:hypothetical protein